MPRVDISICGKCSSLQMQYENKGIKFTCAAKDEEREEEYQKQKRAGLKVGRTVDPLPPNVIGFLQQKTEKNFKLKFDPTFFLASGCPYTLEHLSIQDEKGLVK